MPYVREIMQTDLVTTPPDAPVREFVELLERHGITGAPVVDSHDEALVGVATLKDVIRLARELGEVPEAVRWALGVGTPAPQAAFLGQDPGEGEFFAYYVTPEGQYIDVRDRIDALSDNVFEGYEVQDIMTPEPVTIEASASRRELARLLRDKEVRRALVVDEGKLVGIVTTSDIVRSLAD